MNYASKFDTGLNYAEFLKKYASPDQLKRWTDFRASVVLTVEQQTLLASFTREMKVVVLAGAWCGDCVNQCPIFDQFAATTSKIQIRYFDRDDHPDLATELQTCGGARVPSVLFLSEDNFVCGRYGDKTLSKFRRLVGPMLGSSCATGLFEEADVTKGVVQDWLDEFERIQWMLRTSGRLRQIHGD